MQSRKQVLDRAYRAEEAAEELAEQNDGRGQSYSHQDLNAAHRAGEGSPEEEGGKGLKSAHRAVFFRIGRLCPVHEDRHEEAAQNGQQNSPLEEVLWPVAQNSTFLLNHLSCIILLLSRFRVPWRRRVSRCRCIRVVKCCQGYCCRCRWSRRSRPASAPSRCRL